MNLTLALRPLSAYEFTMEALDLYQTTVPAFSKMLKNLLNILDKGAEFAAAKKIEADVLLQSRLAPDQFPMGRQIQIACDTAKLCTSRLSGKDGPINEDTEKTLPEFKKRIESTLAYLATVTASDFKGANDRHITQPRWEGKYLTGEEYVFHHAIPNFYFHLTTTYSILRNNGVDVGKKDYLGPMPYRT